jgi:hypothetical protein
MSEGDARDAHLLAMMALYAHEHERATRECPDNSAADHAAIALVSLLTDTFAFVRAGIAHTSVPYSLDDIIACARKVAEAGWKQHRATCAKCAEAERNRSS